MSALGSGRTQGSPLRALRLVAALLGASLVLHGGASAEPLGSIKLPEVIPPVSTDNLFPSLLEPLPHGGSWAAEGHRPLGVHLDNYNLTQTQIEAAQRTGCRLVRLAIPMERFLAEAEPDWAVLDQVVSRLERAGLEVLPVLTARVAIPEFYREFCSAVASRYCETFTYYQLLDNINYKIGLDSRGYADLLASVRTAIVLADADAVIVSGGIRGADLTYLEMLLQQGALNSLDVLAFNLYPPRDGVERAPSALRPEHSLPYMQDVILWAKQQGKRVWVTSLGVSTDYTWVGVDQVAQASIYARSALYLGWMGVERIIFAAIQDSDPDYRIPSRCCGLLDVFGTPKASFYALQALNRSVEGAYHVVPPFLFQGHTYNKPSAADLLAATEQLVERMRGTELLNASDMDALPEFRIHELTIYAFWFFAPSEQEYRLIYWLEADQAYPTLVTLLIGAMGDFALRPIERYFLLDNAPSPVNHGFAKNMIFLPYQPVDTIPGVIRFKVQGNGSSG
ncbi:hypothetical protein IIA79_04265 [bacterium]|nr:hypothetical protein [bacterium]